MCTSHVLIEICSSALLKSLLILVWIEYTLYVYKNRLKLLFVFFRSPVVSNVVKLHLVANVGTVEVKLSDHENDFAELVVKGL